MRIEHVAFNVADPVAAARWYMENLAMKPARTFGAPTFTHFLVDASGESMIEIYNNTKAPVPDYRTLDPLVVHLAFEVADVAAVRAQLMQAGATAEGEATIASNGDGLAMLRDPWGFPIQLVKRSQPMLPHKRGD